MMPRILALAAVVISLVGSATSSIAAPALATARMVAGTAYPTWLQVDPTNPRLLYAGGSLGCTAAPAGPVCPVLPPNPDNGNITTCNAPYCPNWAARSEDGGATWSRLERPLGVDADALNGCTMSLHPLILTPGASTLFALRSVDCGTPGSEHTTLLASQDTGNHWSAVASPYSGGYGSGILAVSASPSDPRHVYALFAGGEDGSEQALASLDGATTWALQTPLKAPGTSGQVFATGIVADPHLATAAYANFVDAGNKNAPAGVSRTLDGGRTWTPVVPPAGLAPTAPFSVYTDPQLPGLLFGQTTDPSVPATRRYLSTDQGATWQTTQCPGIHDGTCPSFILSNVFGNSASYAFQPDGIYRFSGTGPAGARLAISDRLPAPVSQVSAVAGGARFGDPVYLLAAQTGANAAAVLYRSSDAGKSWHALPGLSTLPNQQAPSTAPGSMLVPQTHHAVAAPFVATYKRLGLQIIGYPLTEAYDEGDTLVQLFQRLRLELHGTQVVIAPLGMLALNEHIVDQDQVLQVYQYGGGTVPPVANSAILRYFPQTKHTLSGEFLTFWQAHGGIKVLGAPITKVVKDTNGDGSGRLYAVQYFTNARLELHPENKDPRYRVLLGLLGAEWLQYQDWVMPTTPPPATAG
jgi:hypothetical protein